MTKTHYCLECSERLYIISKSTAICPSCETKYRVEHEEEGGRVYPQEGGECVRKQRMRRVTSKAQELAKTRSR